MSSAHIMLFDLTRDVHFAMFLRNWLQYWLEADHQGRLSVVVSRHFVAAHPEIVALAATASRANISIITPTLAETALLNAQERDPQLHTLNVAKLLQRVDQPGNLFVTMWDLFKEYAHSIGAETNVICHIDQLLPLMISSRTVPPAVAGIYFAPTFHYEQVPAIAPRLTAVERSKALQERFVIARALRHPNLKRLIFLDPLVRDAKALFANAEKITCIPEPADISRATPSAIADLRSRLGIKAGRTVLLLFGHLTPRKGIDLLAAALARLPEARCRRICLLLVGPIDARYKAQLARHLSILAQKCPLQVVSVYEYVADNQVAAYFGLADVVCTLYRDHNGPSNIALLAAAAGVPVLSNDYGLLGYTVREQQLGRTVDIEDGEEVARALLALIDHPQAAMGDAQRIEEYVSSHQPRLFAQSFFAALDDDQIPSTPINERSR